VIAGRLPCVLGRGGVSGLPTQIGSLQFGGDMARGPVEPSRNRATTDEQVSFTREHAEDLLADIPSELDVGCSPQRCARHQPLVSSHQLGKRVLRLLPAPTLEEFGIALAGNVAPHSQL
jgi:hypothetical protein